MSTLESYGRCRFVISVKLTGQKRGDIVLFDSTVAHMVRHTKMQEIKSNQSFIYSN